MGESAYPENVLTEMLSAKKAEVAGLAERYETAEKERAELEAEVETQKEFAENLDTWEARFDAADTAAKKSMLLNIIESITVYPKHLTVTYKLEARRIGTLQAIELPDWLGLPETDGTPPVTPNDSVKRQESDVNTHFSARSGVKGSALATRPGASQATARA